MVNYLMNRWFYWKIFWTKVAWLEEEHMEMWTWPWVTLSKSHQGYYCFFKQKPLFFIIFLHISRTFQNIIKLYNKVTFHWVLSELWLKITVPPVLCLCTHARVSGILTRVSPRSIHTAWHTLTRTELSSILPNWTIQFSSFFRIAFSFNFLH